MSFELRDHTADVAVAATGETLADVFAAVADGLAAATCDDIPAVGERFTLSVRAENLEALLFDYLDELVYLRDVREELPVANEVSIEERGDGWDLTGSARGVPLDAVDAREVKAVTYSEMRLESVGGEESADAERTADGEGTADGGESVTREDPVGDGWEAYVVFDV